MLPKTYTARQALLALLVANALRPLRSRVALATSFFASWLTIELAPQILAVQAVDTLRAISRRRASLPGLLLAAASAAGLIRFIQRSNSVPVQIDELLRDLPPSLAPKPRLSAYARPFHMADRGVRVLRDVSYTEGGRKAKLDLYLPREGVVENAPVLIQIHGGGWTIGNKEQQGLLIMNQMAARGWVGVSVNYRLAPKYRWPTQIIDVKRAIAWAREHIAEYGGDPEYLVVTGGSAGGHLSALAALTPHEKEWQPGFEDVDTSVAAAVPFYGVFDFTSDDFYGRVLRDQFLAKVVFPRDAGPEDFRSASPTHRIDTDVPEFLVVHGAIDTLAQIKQARAFVERLRAVSPGSVTYLELPGTQHAFEVFGSVRARHVIRGVGRWLEWHRAQWLEEQSTSNV